jgi:hypothetical protein
MKDRYINDLLAKQAYISDNLARKDPFDKAIRKAVESAKKSIKMDEDQEDKALRNSLLTWSEEMHKMPRTKGLLANFAQAGRALLPALKTHDIYEDAAEEENLKMLQHAQQKKAAEEAKAAQLEAAAYQREMADKQMAHQGAMLEEQKRYHNQSLFAKLAKGMQKKETPFDKKHRLGIEGLTRTIDDAIATINRNQELSQKTGLDSKGEAGLIRRGLDSIGIAQLTPEQAEIQTLGSLLAGYGNKLMNYTNQVEFESLPHISPYTSDATNLATLKKMKNIMLRDAEEAKLDSGGVNVPPNTTRGLSGYGEDVDTIPNNFKKVENRDNASGFISLYDHTNNKYYKIPSNKIEEAKNANPNLITTIAQ